MAFVARTTRDNNPIGNVFRQVESGSHIGPGSYAAPTSFGRRQPAFVPFASSTTRYNPANSGKSHGKSAIPSPFLAFSERFENKVRSFELAPCPPGVDWRCWLAFQKSEQLPGPGAYAIKSAFEVKAGTPSHSSGGRPDALAPVSWQREPNPPSIPTRSQSFGYEQGGGGKLIPQAPPQAGHTGTGKGERAIRGLVRDGMLCSPSNWCGAQ
jgi:hypothetical protein